MCDPACGPCERCNGTTCDACEACCHDACCDGASAVCHAGSGDCCVPDANEQIIGTLDGSMFHLRFWESSHRGGLHVYQVPKGEWEAVSQLGAILAEGAGG